MVWGHTVISAQYPVFIALTQSMGVVGHHLARCLDILHFSSYFTHKLIKKPEQSLKSPLYFKVYTFFIGKLKFDTSDIWISFKWKPKHFFQDYSYLILDRCTYTFFSLKCLKNIKYQKPMNIIYSGSNWAKRRTNFESKKWKQIQAKPIIMIHYELEREMTMLYGAVHQGGWTQLQATCFSFGSRMFSIKFH